MTTGLTRSYLVAAAEAGQRLDSFLAAATGRTRSLVQKLIKKGRVTLNKRPAAKSGLIVKEKDRLTVFFPPPEPDRAVPEPIPLDILHEDKDIIVINKPAGLVVHPAAGHRRGTLVNALLFHCKNLSGIGGVLRPGIVHRLDKETSGVLIAAKNDAAHLKLAGQFKDRRIDKTYLAIVQNRPRSPAGVISGRISRHAKHRQKMAFAATALPAKGKEAISRYRTLGSAGNFSLIEIKPLTGRTHQIRVQLAAIGCPLAGDIKYGGRSLILSGQGHFLHAWKLGLFHPATGQKEDFAAPPPPAFREALAWLKLDFVSVLK